MKKLWGKFLCYFILGIHAFPIRTKHKNNWIHFTCPRCGYGIRARRTGSISLRQEPNYFNVIRSNKLHQK